MAATSPIRVVPRWWLTGCAPTATSCSATGSPLSAPALAAPSDFEEATVGGVLDLTGSTIESTSDSEHRWLLDGLAYSGVPRLADRDNRAALQELLRKATPSYAAQPYQQLAAAYRSEGHDADARAVLMQQRPDQLDRGALTDRRDRVWARVTGALLGYGYRSSRALVYLVGVLALSVTLAVLLGGHGALAPTPDLSPAAAPSAAAPAVQHRPAHRQGSRPGDPVSVRCTHRRRQLRGHGHDDRRGADRRPMGSATGGLGTRSAVHRRVHRYRPPQLKDRSVIRVARPSVAGTVL